MFNVDVYEDYAYSYLSHFILHSCHIDTSIFFGFAGEMGFLRVEMGKNILGLEGEVAWVTPGSWTEVNFPCAENGANCNDSNAAGAGFGRTDGAMFYKDPSSDVEAIQRRLQHDNRV